MYNNGRIAQLLNKLQFVVANRNYDSKLRYLRKLGCKIGDNTRFIGRAYLGTEPYLIEIGENCLLSNVHFYTHDGGVAVLNNMGYFEGNPMDKMARIRIGNNCFIGGDVRIMGGVTIGDNCIIGTCSVVTKNIPPNSVVAGIPAKIICTIDDYYIKNCNRNVFFPILRMTAKEKKEYLLKHVPDVI